MEYVLQEYIIAVMEISSVPLDLTTKKVLKNNNNNNFYKWKSNQ